MHGAVYAREPHYVNSNAYHPLFTLVIGTLLIQFNPDVAYWVWFWAKPVISLAGVGYFDWSFRKNTSVQFAVFILLANFNSYLELAAGQFQILVNIFLLLFLTAYVKKKATLLTGLWYWLSLLVKPVGLLFVPLFLFKKRHRTVIPLSEDCFYPFK